MLNVPAELAAAIDASERTIRALVSVDWDGDGHGPAGSIDDLTPMVAGFDLDRAVVGDLPDQVRITQGSAAAQARIQLVGAPPAPAGMIAVRSSASDARNTFRTEPGETILIPPPAQVRRGDYLLLVLTAAHLSGTVLPYVVGTDIGVFNDEPSGLGWETLWCDTAAGTAVRTWVFGKRADDTDVRWSARPLPYTFRINLGDCSWTAATLALAAAAPHRPGVWRVEAAAQTVHTGQSTTHTTPTVAVESEGVLLVSAFARRATTAIDWQAQPGDVELLERQGSSSGVAVDLMVAVSAPVGPGQHSRTASTATPVGDVTAAIVAVAPVQALAGERGHAGWYLSPLNDAAAVSGRDSARLAARLDVELATTAGPRTVPRLRGFARTVTVSADARDATVRLLDGRERMRHTVLLPPIDGQVYGANATWVITNALAHGGWTVSPRPRGVLRLVSDTGAPPRYAPTRTVVQIPFHGSLWPWWQYTLRPEPTDFAGPDLRVYRGATGGFLTDQDVVTPSFVPGPYVLGLFCEAVNDTTFTVMTGSTRAVNNLFLFRAAGASSNPDEGRLEVWLRADPRPPTVPPVLVEDWWMAVVAGVFPDFVAWFGVKGNNRLGWTVFNWNRTIVRLNAEGPTLPADGRWHFVGIKWRLDGTTPSVTFRLDGADITVGLDPAAVAAAGLPAFEASAYSLASFLPIAELALHAVPGGDGWANQLTTVDAQVDPSTLDLAAVAQPDAREAWQLVTEIGRAESAVVYVDELGHFRYRTRARLLTEQMSTSQLTLSADASITAIRAENTVDLVRNIIEQPWQAPAVLPGFVWTLPAPRPLEADDQFQTAEFALDGHLAATFLDAHFQSSTTPLPAASYLIANTKPDGTGTPVATGVSALLLTLDAAGSGKIQWSNVNPFGVFVTEAKMFGRRIQTTAQPPMVAADRASVSLYGEQPLTLSSSPWVQRADVAARLTRQTLLDLRLPQTVLTDLAIRGDPRLQLLDRVRVIDRDGIGVDHHWWITGLRESHTPAGGYTMRVDARRALPVAVWGQHRWGEATWGLTP